jgi:PAN domain
MGARPESRVGMLRALIVGVAALISAAAATATGVAPAFAQSGYDRPGGDYASAAVANGDPAVCATRCEHDKSCRSWSFSYPPASGGPAMCRLKREVIPRVPSSCCVSGGRGGGVIEPKLGELEYSIDRVGGDYRSFETAPDPRGKPCAETCQAESRCRAWTYRRPGYGTAGARRYLKDAVKPPRRRPCCISGVVR